jgi:hypothetical protein
VAVFSAGADEPPGADAIRTAGARARFGQEICGMDAAYLREYEVSLKARAATPDSFAFQWKAGWTSQEGTLLEYQALKATDPAEYASRVRADCARLRRAIDITPQPRTPGPPMEN